MGSLKINCNCCGACCVEISISSPIPGMPNGKPAGVACIHLKDSMCAIFNHPDRPKVCGSFQASLDICGTNKEEATALIRWYEKETS